MSDPTLDRLRAAVAGHSGAARARPLAELGQALADRYWRAGPGTPAAKPVLDEAVEALGEAHGYFEPDDGMGGQVANLLGWMHGIRHVAHGGPADDRDAGIRLLDKSLRFPQLPPVSRLVGRVVLGQLLLSRVTAGMQSGGIAMMRPGAGNGDADRAVECFREVLAEPAGNAEIMAVARTLLTMAEAMRDMTSGRPDLAKMMTAMSTLQNLQQSAAMRGGGLGGMTPPTLTVEDLVNRDPLDRPTIVMDGTVRKPPSASSTPKDAEPKGADAKGTEPKAAEPTRPAGPPGAAESAAAESAAFTAAAREAIDRMVPGPGTVRGWLVDAPPVEVVDEVVALGSALVAAGEAAAAHHVAYAAALFLRDADSGWDDSGWDKGSADKGSADKGSWDDDGGNDDLRAAADALVAAGEGLWAAGAEAVIAACRWAERIDGRRGTTLARLGETFAGVAAAVRRAGADGLLFAGGGDAVLLTTGGFAEQVGALPPYVLVVGDPPAAEPGTAIGRVSSAAQVVTLAGRDRRPVTAEPVFVANPRGDRPAATMDALRLRRTFYPRSTGLGEVVENVDGAGTVAEVTARLTASLLHLGCGVTPDGALELADGTLKPAGGAGGVAVLPPTPHADALADALLDGGFAAVIGIAADVPDRVVSLVSFLLHAELVDASRPPAEAVREVHRRLAAGEPPASLPADLAAVSAGVDPADWRMLTCYGW